MNATVNGTVANLTTRAFDNGTEIVQAFFPLVLHRMWELVAAPFSHPEMLWILFPLALTLLVLEFYFDRHGDDELGWAAAVANSLILFIIAIDLIKHSFHYETPWYVAREIVLAIFTEAELSLPPQVLVLILFIGLLGVVITLINYYHLLPKKLAFEVSGHPPINFLAYFAIVIVYTAGTPEEIPLDIPTLVAGVFVFIILLVIVFYIRRFWRNRVHGRRNRTIFTR